MDRTGIALSALCTVHCLALPILVAALPSTKASLDAFAGPWLHDVLGVVLPLVAAVALWSGFRRHGRLVPIMLGIVGVLTLWVALFGGAHDCTLHDHGQMQAGLVFGFEGWVTTLGSALLVTAHVMNMKASCPGCSKSACAS